MTKYRKIYDAFNLRLIDSNTLYRIQQAARATGLEFNFNQCESVYSNGIVRMCRCCIRHEFYRIEEK